MGDESRASDEDRKLRGRLLNQICEFLRPALPNGEEFTVLYVKTKHDPCRKLVFTRTSDERLDSLATHFFILVHDNIALVALELYTYISPDFSTIFVSKADTTGYYKGSGRLNVMAVMQAVIRGVTLSLAPLNKKIRICLFAKAETQYLFLGSNKNPTKHVLSDAQLVKWWIRCLDQLHDLFKIDGGKFTLEIPGVTDARALSTYFPVNAQLPWKKGDIFWDTATAEEDDLALAVKRIPRFPDDPKSRFLDAIVSERRAKSVTRQQFWLELQSRQEFRLGKSVGLIGVEAELATHSKDDWIDFGKTSREMKRFKTLLFDLNFKTLGRAKNSTERLLDHLSEDFYQMQIKGTGSLSASLKRSHSESAAPPQVNTLNTSLIRKKKKVDT